LEFPHLSVDVNRLGDRHWVLVAIFFMVIAGSACSRNDASRGVMAPLMAKVQVAQEDHGSTLSRQHTIVINVPETELETRFRSVSDHCTTDSAHHCTILQRPSRPLRSLFLLYRSVLPALNFHSQSPTRSKIAACELGSTVKSNLDGRDRSVTNILTDRASFTIAGDMGTIGKASLLSGYEAT
jgi:hypothetical protein